MKSSYKPSKQSREAGKSRFTPTSEAVGAHLCETKLLQFWPDFGRPKATKAAHTIQLAVPKEKSKIEHELLVMQPLAGYCKVGAKKLDS